MTSEQRKEIEAKIGRTLTAEEIARGSITRKEDRRKAEQAEILKVSPRWMEESNEASATLAKASRHTYPDGRTRETKQEFRKRMHAEREQRAEESKASAEQADKLATDPVYREMNNVAAQTVERLRWDSSYPQSAWLRAIQMQESAKANDRETFQALNKEHVEYLDSITNERQSAIDNQIAQLQQLKQSFADDRFEQPLPAPSKESYSHIKRASGMMQFVNKTDGYIEEYDPRVPQAREAAEQNLAKHQADTAGRYGKSIPVQSLMQ